MTNREYLATLSDEELSCYIYKGILEKIGIRYNTSIGGVASWLGSEHHESDDYEYMVEGKMFWFGGDGE